MKNLRISDNFFLSEFLESETANKYPNILAIQNSPPTNIIENLKYLTKTTLQPARSYFDYSFDINSGWRCDALNAKVRGSSTSQHLFGEAADVDVDDSMIASEELPTKHAIEELRRRIERLVYQKPRSNVNANYYVFAYFVIHMEELDIDQVIHEYGKDGKPKWVHVSSSASKNNRRITVKRSGERYIDMTLTQALLLGC